MNTDNFVGRQIDRLVITNLSGRRVYRVAWKNVFKCLKVRCDFFPFQIDSNLAFIVAVTRYQCEL